MNNLTKLKLAQNNESIFRLFGARLTSVQFVLDYLILGFDDVGALTTLVWPELYSEVKILTFGVQGYRDALCLLIEKTVKGASVTLDETIIIEFENGGELRIPLGSYKAVGERAILTGPKHYLFVF